MLRRSLRLLLVLAAGTLTSGACAVPAFAIDFGVSVAPMAPLDVGYTEVFTITATNVDPDEDSDGVVSVSATLPSTLSFVSAAGDGWTCSSGPNLSCTVDDYWVAGEVLPPITLKAIPQVAALPSIGIVFSLATQDDPDLSDNIVPVTYPVHYYEDLGVDTSHFGTWNIGSTERIKLAVSNPGDDDSFGTIIVRDQLPGGVTVATIVPTPGWTCGTDSSNIVTCTSSNELRSGTTHTIASINVAVSAAAAPVATDTASLFYDADENAANNVSSATSNLAFQIDLGVGVSAPGPLQAGQASTITVPVTNGGKSPTTGLTTLTIAVPPGVAVGAVTGTQWTCSGVAPIVCTTPPGRRIYQSVSVVLTPSRAMAPGFAVSASVATDGEQNPANNATSASLAVAVNCIVPKINGVTYKKALHRLVAANCQGGHVTVVQKPKKLRRFKTKRVVMSTRPHSGTFLPADAKVKIKVKYVRK